MVGEVDQALKPASLEVASASDGFWKLWPSSPTGSIASMTAVSWTEANSAAIRYALHLFYLAQKAVDLLLIEPLWVEISSRPDQHVFVIRMLRIPYSLQKL